MCTIIFTVYYILYLLIYSESFRWWDWRRTYVSKLWCLVYFDFFLYQSIFGWCTVLEVKQLKLCHTLKGFLTVNNHGTDRLTHTHMNTHTSISQHIHTWPGRSMFHKKYRPIKRSSVSLKQTPLQFHKMFHNIRLLWGRVRARRKKERAWDSEKERERERGGKKDR